MRTKGDVPDEELSNCGGALDEGRTDGLNVKFEGDSRDDRVGVDLLFVVCNAVLICVKWPCAWGNMNCWDDTKEVLICDKFRRNIM